MPLRDHFRPPVSDKHTWAELHAMWPAMIVRHLFDILPEGLAAAPSVHLGKEFEIDVSASAENAPAGPDTSSPGEGGVASVAPPEPTLSLEADLVEQDEFEVRVYDTDRGRQLVAAIKIVSPSNKDRPENRRVFVAKVAALLQKDVCVSVVDLVTIRQFNLYAELLALIGGADPYLASQPPNTYAVTVRGRKRERRALVDL